MLDFLLAEPITLYLLLGLYSLAMGSFLNVVIYRLPLMLQKDWRNQCIDYLNLDKHNYPRSSEAFNLFKPNSHCPKCQQAIKPWTNIPLLGYLMLGGRCSHCKEHISWRYPFIELLTALLAIYMAWHFGWSWQAAAATVFAWYLICLTFIDFDHQLLPDGLTLSLLWLGLIININSLFCSSSDAILGAAMGYSSLWLVAHLFKWVSGRDGMGQGDFKLLAALGAWVGWQLLPLIILLSSATGALIGISLILFRGHQRQIPIPFGPYLAIAGFIALLWGKPLMTIYTQAN